jgi:hypothetical protein
MVAENDWPFFAVSEFRVVSIRARIRVPAGTYSPIATMGSPVELPLGALAMAVGALEIREWPIDDPQAGAMARSVVANVRVLCIGIPPPGTPALGRPGVQRTRA